MDRKDQVLPVGHGGEPRDATNLIDSALVSRLTLGVELSFDFSIVTTFRFAHLTEHASASGSQFIFSIAFDRHGVAPVSGM